MAIPISSTAQAEPVDVVIKQSPANGLRRPSVARIHRLSAVLEEDLLEEIGIVNSTYQRAITTALKTLLKM